mgnify:FL=1
MPLGLTIINPSNNTNSSDNALDVNYTYTETNVDSCWYSNDSYKENISLTDCTTNITGVTWAEGPHNVTIYINDFNRKVLLFYDFI